MNRRGFFAAILAPLVVPWRKYPPEYITVMGPFPGPGVPRCSIRPVFMTQHQLNALYNQRIDNITLSL